MAIFKKITLRCSPPKIPLSFRRQIEAVRGAEYRIQIQNSGSDLEREFCGQAIRFDHHGISRQRRDTSR